MSSIEIKVGSKNFDLGQTILTIDSDGLIRATNITEKEKFEIKRQVDKSRFAKLYELLSSGELQAIKPRKGVPDEAKYVFSIAGKDQVTKIEIWDNDLDQFKSLNTFLLEMRDLLHKESKQKIIL